MVLDIGRVCVKTAGREAGRLCVVIDRIDETYVMVTGPKTLTKVRRRKCNIAHLEPLELQLKLAKNAPDSEVERLLRAGKIPERFAPGTGFKPEKLKPAPPEKPAEAPEREKKGLRERLLGRAKKGEKPGKPKEEKKSEEPREKPSKPKEKPRPKKPALKKPPKKTKPAKKPRKKPSHRKRK